MSAARSVGYPATVCVDLDAIAENATRMQEYAGDAALLAVVKADGYGMGRSKVAGYLWERGIRWFGTARIPEAAALRRALSEVGADPSDTRIMAWLNDPEDGWELALNHQIDISVATKEQLRRLTETVKDRGYAPARVHVKVDTGMGRGGATLEDLPALADAISQSVADASIKLVGIWSHLALADDMSDYGKQFTQRQVDRFEEAIEVLRSRGLEPEVRHLAATSGALWHPETRYDMVRIGIGLYGMSPNPEVATSAELGLRPAEALRSRLNQVKRVEPGATVSYGATWVSPDHHWIGLVPLGYQDGVPRALSNIGQIAVEAPAGPTKVPIIGRVCMDQFVVDLGNGEEPLAQADAVVTLFGDPQRGEPSVDDWALEAGTINYEISARIAHHLERVYTCAACGSEADGFDEGTR